MSLKTSSAKLGRAARGFRGTWERARADWRDARALAFEQQVMTLFESCLMTALTGMDHMEGVLARARSDCG